MQKRISHVLIMLFLVMSYGRLQGQSATVSSDAKQVLEQMQSALWGSAHVSSIQVTGSATWYMGSEVEQGNASLMSNSSGEYTVQLSLGQLTRREIASALTSDRECQWSGSDGVLHMIDYYNCMKPLTWFAPGITLQNGQIPAIITIQTIGDATTLSGTWVELQSQTVIDGLTNSPQQIDEKCSVMTLDLTPSTMLPGELHYCVHPDNGDSANVEIRIVYSDYRKVGAMTMPYHIQRYVNGSLQLDLEISSVTFT